MRYMHNIKNIDKKLREIIRLHNVTQADIARAAGVTPAAICQIISGKRATTVKTASKIINAIVEGKVTKKPRNGAHPLYSTWLEMRKRCNQKNRKDYKYYGHRGISVDPSWDDFNKFVEDMGDKPTKKHTIDRINNDGNYSKDNCRWATMSEQARNKNFSKYKKGDV